MENQCDFEKKKDGKWMRRDLSVAYHTAFYGLISVFFDSSLRLYSPFFGDLFFWDFFLGFFLASSSLPLLFLQLVSNFIAAFESLFYCGLRISYYCSIRLTSPQFNHIQWAKKIDHIRLQKQ